MKKLKIVFLGIVFLFLGVLSSCGSQEDKVNYKDGTYEGKSENHTADNDGVGAGYAICIIEIKDNKITSCDFKLYELDGTLKDEKYGSEYSKENYIKAQKAIQSATKYAKSLVESSNINSVDVISGATITYSEFKEAVNNALNKAKE